MLLFFPAGREVFALSDLYLFTSTARRSMLSLLCTCSVCHQLWSSALLYLRRSRCAPVAYPGHPLC